MKFSFVSIAIAIAAILVCTYAETDTAKGMCKLGKSSSVEYRCLVKGTGSRSCKDLEPNGTVVQAECSLGYYSPVALPYMRCIEGSWDYIANCVPDCGTVPLNVENLQGSALPSSAVVPWHATVYKKTTTSYTAICSGTLVTKNTVLSVAHCFWDSINRKQLPVENYAVAVGKTHRAWSAKEDQLAQKSDVTDIKIPARFQGLLTNWQENIAVVILAKEVTFGAFVRPVCLDFDVGFERRQLQTNALGKTAAWALTESLKVLEMLYVPFEECFSSSPTGFREYITSDKICVRSNNGTTLCRGDSGAGFSFPEQGRGTTRYYLRGIASTAPKNTDGCSTDESIVLLTQISKHEHFIKEFI